MIEPSVLDRECGWTAGCTRPAVGMVESDSCPEHWVFCCRSCARLFGLEIRLFQLSNPAWLELGVALGFCGPAVCATHDGIPSSVAEIMSLETGDDVCIYLVRLYTDADHKRQVESNDA